MTSVNEQWPQSWLCVNLNKIRKLTAPLLVFFCFIMLQILWNVWQDGAAGRSVKYLFATPSSSLTHVTKLRSLQTGSINMMSSLKCPPKSQDLNWIQQTGDLHHECSVTPSFQYGPKSLKKAKGDPTQYTESVPNKVSGECILLNILFA